MPFLIADKNIPMTNFSEPNECFLFPFSLKPNPCIFNKTLDFTQNGPWNILQNAQIMSQNKHLRPGCIQNFHWRFPGLSGLFENLYQELIQDAA